MPDTSLISRVLRLQFSLRALLVMMAAVGVALVVFRWPWVEETTQQELMRTDLLYGEDSPGHDLIIRDKSGRWQHHWRKESGVFSMNDVDDYRITTTYRRGWNGKPQRSGARQYWRLHETERPVLVMEKHYVDDDLRQVIHFDDWGEKTYSRCWLNGLPHGKSGTSPQAGGRYQAGKRVGTWHTSYLTYAGPYYEGAETIAVQQSYRDGLLDGEWIWKGENGRVLQTARYDAGRLVEWNGLAKEQAIKVLLTKCNLAEANYAQLQRSAVSAKLSSLKSNDQKFDQWELQIDDQPTGLVLSSRQQTISDNWVLVVNRNFEFPADQPPVEAFLEEALSSSETLVVRSHQLFLVKISAAEVGPSPFVP